jgi:hypothetical protein
MILAIVLLLAAADADGGVPPDADSQLEQELQKAIQSDQAAAGKKDPQAQASPEPVPAAASAGNTPTLLRGSQSLNPDISAILDADFGWQRRPMSLLNGDDPNLHPEPRLRAVGPAVQEVELAFTAIVDPYFKGEVYLTIPNLRGIEVEEAFATTTSLPWNLQAKMGSFRSAFGRQNGQHLHVQDFTRRPLLNAAFLGPDGLRGPAAQVSWLSPLPFFLTIYGEVLGISADPPALPDQGPGDPVGTFGANASRKPTLAGEAKAFFPFGDDWSLYVGGSVASGRSPGVASPCGASCVCGSVACPTTVGAGRDTALIGGDVYLKWKPPNVASGYNSVAFQAEAMFRHFGEGGSLPAEWDGGFYAQVVVQAARRWFIGARYDLVGLPSSSVLARIQRYSASLTFQASEFARVRGYLEVEHASDTSGTLLPYITFATAPAAFLQLEISIGAHGAHPF